MDIEIITEFELVSIAKKGNVEMFKFILNLKPSLDICFNNNYIFKTVCEKNHVELAKYILKLKPEIKDIINDNFFNYLCIYECLDILKWLLSISYKINTSNNNFFPFVISCENGRIKTAKWLYHINPNFNISSNNDLIFKKVCKNGHLEIAKWLYKKKPNINISHNEESAFCNACFGGHLEVSKWLLQVKSDIDIHIKDNICFVWVCTNKNLDIAKWLYSITPSVYLNDDNDYILFKTCLNNDVETVKWLHSIKKIDFSKNRHRIFKTVCLEELVEIAIYLQSIRPHLYWIEVIDNKIIDFGIKKQLFYLKEKKVKKIENCNICFDKISDTITECKHQFCKECLSTWYKTKETCPYCRTFIVYVYKIESK
jgi:ankyrin repeat protein